MLIKVSGKIKSGKDTIGKMIQVIMAEKDQSLSIEDPSDIREKRSGWEIKKFAGPLKEIVSIMTGYSLEQLEQEEVKNMLLPIEWQIFEIYDFDKKKAERFYSIQDAVNFCDEHSNSQHQFRYQVSARTVRWLLQYVGTELFRDKLHTNVHINMLLSKYTPQSNWIITDTRFYNELACRAIDGTGLSIRVERPLHERHPELWHKFENRPPASSRATFFDWLEWHDIDTYEKLTHRSETELDKAEFNYTIVNDGDLAGLYQQIKTILTEEKLI